MHIQTNISIHERHMLAHRVLDQLSQMTAVQATSSAQAGTEQQAKKPPLEVVTCAPSGHELMRELTASNAEIGETESGQVLLERLGLEEGANSGDTLMRMLTMREVVSKSAHDPSYGIKRLTQDMRAAGIDLH